MTLFRLRIFGGQEDYPMLLETFGNTELNQTLLLDLVEKIDEKIIEFTEKVIKEEKFRDLTLTEQKKIFIAMLNNNQMYVNKTEMADKKYGISETDPKMTAEFYGEK